jgi:hypothetical protein
MALTQLEINLCNQAFSLIGAAKVVLATQATTVEGIAANDFYVQTRDALLRSFEWSFARGREKLSLLYAIEFDTTPGPDAFAVGDVITGITSGATATIIEVLSDVEYTIAYLSGTFSDSETVTNGTISTVVWQGIPVYSGTDQVIWYDTATSDQVVCTAGYPLLTEAVPDFGYEHQFLLPADFLRMTGQSYHNHRYTIEGNRLLSNHLSSKLLYVKKVTDTTLFDALFIEVLVLRLALKFKPAVAGTVSGDTIANIKQDLKMAEGKARVVDFQEDNDSGSEDWLNARFGSTEGVLRVTATPMPL